MDLLSLVADWIISVLAGMSGTTLFVTVTLLMFLNSSLMFPPSEWIGIGAGISAALIGENLILLFLVATAANFLGTLIWYYVGVHQSQSGSKQSRSNAPAKQSPSYNVIGYLFYPYVRWLTHIENVIRSRGALGIFILRLFPVIRSIVSWPAGRIRMALIPFTVASLLGMGAWSFLWIYLGYKLGELSLNLMFPFALIAAILSFTLFCYAGRILDLLTR